jgi:hypothetical protein
MPSADMALLTHSSPPAADTSGTASLQPILRKREDTRIR